MTIIIIIISAVKKTKKNSVLQRIERKKNTAIKCNMRTNDTNVLEKECNEFEYMIQQQQQYTHKKPVNEADRHHKF